MLGEVLEQPQEVEEEARLVGDEEVDEDAEWGSVQWRREISGIEVEPRPE